MMMMMMVIKSLLENPVKKEKLRDLQNYHRTKINSWDIQLNDNVTNTTVWYEPEYKRIATNLQSQLIKYISWKLKQQNYWCTYVKVATT